jgi:hypothetical protein
MLSVFVWPFAAGADVEYSFLVPQEVSIASVEVRDMSCNPILEGFREFIHHLAHTVPIDIIKCPWRYLISLAEELLGF